ncbi:LuxE/PaaK family acyltransferase [Streptomyces clavifer]|uniref:LuxE/PaaK family acyltransferase n=1 Tax=Streptomyces clavifer TaxID=68188 RepID=UPI0036B3D3F6
MSGVAPQRAVTRLAGVAELDRVIFEEDRGWSASAEEQAELRTRLISEALAHHLEASPRYARFAEAAGFDLASIGGPADLARVPQFPTQMFKRAEIRSVPESDCHLFVSSGTSGTHSNVWRDDTSLQRLAGSLRPESDIWGSLFDGVDLDDEGEMLHLGPPRSEAGGVWISYVLSLVEMFTSTRSYVHDGVLRLGDAANDLEDALGAGRFVSVSGPPVFVTALLQYMADNGRKAGAADRMVIITGGGWKRDQTGRIDPAELRSRAVETFGLRDGSQVRDVFNQVELNTAFTECEAGRKHVPPWVQVFARSPYDMGVLPDGEVGLLSYLDPSAHSYPCFLLCEDFGSTQTDQCSCGRYGTTVEVQRRISTATHQGCALRLAGETALG